MLFEFASFCNFCTCVLFLVASIAYYMQRFRDGKRISSVLLVPFMVLIAMIPFAYFANDSIDFGGLAAASLIDGIWWGFIADFMHRLDRRALFRAALIITCVFAVMMLVYAFIDLDIAPDLIS